MSLGPLPFFTAPGLLTGALTRAAVNIGRLDNALEANPLLPAILFRARLDAVRRQAAADGFLIDKWQLAGLIEGLRPNLRDTDSIAERGQVFEAARAALALHGWLADPDFDQEGEIQKAERAMSEQDLTSPIMAAGLAMHKWIDANNSRTSIRAALPRFWRSRRLLRAPLPLTGARSLGGDVPWAQSEWLPIFFDDLADEADEMLQTARDLAHGWRSARSMVTPRRKTSHAYNMVDLLAAAPLLSSSTASRALSIAPKNAIRILAELQAEGAAVEVSHREKRKLYALPGMSPMKDALTAPKRPEPGRGRGRPQVKRDVEEDAYVPQTNGSQNSPPLPSFQFDYGNLEEAMAALDDTVRKTKLAINRLTERSDD
ncbi:hypothetical protein [Acidocella facilis]|uniref:hypothetical protein n=1 Tax=Acidocella facilis TaxID=525 RepID=UPI001F1C2D6E|nr:hypothetical protein [Acidocella facilis]